MWRLKSTSEVRDNHEKEVTKWKTVENVLDHKEKYMEILDKNIETFLISSRYAW